MDTLYSDLSKNLTQPIIKKLSQNRIKTLIDFLQEDIEKLSNLTKLEIPCILQIRKNIFEIYSATVVNSLSLFNTVCSRITELETGIESLDSILNGGINIGYITEVCGLAGSGKTQLCMQLAVNCVKNRDKTVLYIDSKGDFSAIRIQKVLEECSFSHKEMAAVMLKIKVAFIWTMDELVDILLQVKNNKNEYNCLSLIILDSLPSLMFQHFGDENKIGLKFLNIFVNHVKYICKTMEVAVICVNIQTRWIDQSVSDVNDNESSDLTTSDTYYRENINRCLGKYWKNIPKTIIILEKIRQKNTQIENNDTHIQTTVLNCDIGQIKKSVLTITSSGVI
ncbi:DNA repair protein RAD51 homolog 4 [Leptidea sinapis]|uniref:RecA family profile 1 domain-containing protein n=1 Tax=Leptidea sinapis TaxID=189913 RepID=A0A5E4PUI3_9NEOP|nr:DNA repair protein RAD51 homolog 4 [Leptidea sinapis]VVC89746.1 unnamed protein product [Leptidea sinapis]